MYCGVCGREMETTLPDKASNGEWTARAQCSRCAVSVDLPMLKADCLVLE